MPAVWLQNYFNLEYSQNVSAWNRQKNKNIQPGSEKQKSDLKEEYFYIYKNIPANNRRQKGVKTYC